MAFHPGKANTGNQVLTWDGTKYIWQGPVVNYNAPAPGDWRRHVDRTAQPRRAMSFDLVLKEGSVSGGLDALKPRDLCYFAGAGPNTLSTNSDNQHNRLAILCQDATSTVLFVDSTISGGVYNAAALPGTAAGWKWISVCHYSQVTVPNTNVFVAYNDIDGTLVRFRDNTFGAAYNQGITVLGTHTIGTGGCRPLFDGVSFWCQGGGDLIRLDNPHPNVPGAGAASTTVVDAGGYTGGGLMSMDIGGAIYAVRQGSNQLVKVQVVPPYTIHRQDISSFSPPAGAGTACDGQNVWFTTSTGVAKYPLASMVNTAHVSHPTLVPNGGLACNGAMLASASLSAPNHSVIFTDLDATFPSATPASGPQEILQTVVDTATITGCTHISHPVVVPNTHGVAEFYYLCYNDTPAGNAQVRAFRYNPDMAVNSFMLTGGLSFNETVISSATGSSPFQLHVDQHIILVDLSGFGAGIQLDLPSRPTRGCQFLIKDVSGQAATKNITINCPDGSTTGIDFSTATNVINTNYGFRRLQYSPHTTFSSNGRWFVIGSG